MLTVTWQVGLAVRRLFSSEMSKPVVVFVLGGPGAGKGTQCEKIVKEFGFIHLSAGELLREEQKSGSENGELIDTYIKEGKIVPVEITVGLLEKAMQQNTVKKFLVDGFPRNENNLEGWTRMMSEKVDMRAVLFFDCPEEVCVNRIMQRSKSSGRSDDNEDSLRKRFKTYYNQTMPIIEHYKKGGLVHKINAIPQPDEVFEEVKLTMSKLLQI